MHSQQVRADSLSVAETREIIAMFLLSYDFKRLADWNLRMGGEREDICGDIVILNEQLVSASS